MPFESLAASMFPMFNTLGILVTLLAVLTTVFALFSGRLEALPMAAMMVVGAVLFMGDPTLFSSLGIDSPAPEKFTTVVTPAPAPQPPPAPVEPKAFTPTATPRNYTWLLWAAGVITGALVLSFTTGWMHWYVKGRTAAAKQALAAALEHPSWTGAIQTRPGRRSVRQGDEFPQRFWYPSVLGGVSRRQVPVLPEKPRKGGV